MVKALSHKAMKFVIRDHKKRNNLSTLFIFNISKLKPNQVR